MQTIMAIIRVVLYTIPFIGLCIAAKNINLPPVDRSKQFLMPLITLSYCMGMIVGFDWINGMITRGLEFVANYIPYLGNLNFSKYQIYIFNIVMLLVYLAVKKVALLIVERTWGRSKKLVDATAGLFYEYAEDIGKWVAKKEYEQVRYYCSAIYYMALGVSCVVFAASQIFPDAIFFQAVFYPAVGVLILGEVISFLSGMTKSEFVEDILGEDEEAYKVVNYGLLRSVLEGLFGKRVLFSNTTDSGLSDGATYATLEEMCKSPDKLERNYGEYFKALKERGEDITEDYVKSCIQMIHSKSVLFCNPFYRDLAEYIMLPMIRQLMRYRKCLVIMGRDSATDDVLDWLRESLYKNVNTECLWKAEILEEQETEADIGIMKFSDLYNLEIQKHNQKFLGKVGFVFIVEPSRLLATGQVGLSLLVSRFNTEKEHVVYCACDRNCDGLVDALSHTLKTNITEVSATSPSSCVNSAMCWDADGDYMHHKIISNISRYLGIGTEINSVALKYQINDTKWYSSEKFPVLDMKWIAGQYYKKICEYANMPVSQESFNKSFKTESNLWSAVKQENLFMVVEDEFQNMFEILRVFATRAKQQGFVNVISENYLLRQYMIDNVQTFLADPKAIPTIVADYTRSERNTILKLVMRMNDDRISEDELVKEYMLSGIAYKDPLKTLKELIKKHCFVDEINIKVSFREVLMEDALRTEIKKYYSIEEQSEIAEYANNLKNAYYIAEDEKGDKYYIGAKLYGHVFQTMLPGQFLTFNGKYYEVQTITSHNGVVLRRAADHLTNRKYYRQFRRIKIADWKEDESVGGKKTISDILISKGYCQIEVQTEGYLEMRSYGDLKSAREVKVSGIPNREYRNKLAMRIHFPNSTEKIRYTICVLMNEMFKTIYPDAYPYICAATHTNKKMEDNFKYVMYELEDAESSEDIFIIEDSEIDLGLIASVERNLKRYLELITEVLSWHDTKMKEKPQKEEPKEYVPEFPPAPPEEEKAEEPEEKGLWGKIKGWFRRFVAKFRKKQPTSEEQPANRSVMRSETKDAKLDIEGEDEESEIVKTEDEEELTEYQKTCFLKFGFDTFNDAFDLEGTVEYLTGYGYDKNPLSQVRNGAELAEEYEKEYNPKKVGAHFCDFCAIELTGGEYERLKDGRERCNYCSRTALRSGEEIKDVFKAVQRNMEIFYGIKLNVAIKVRMTDAKKIAAHFGETFVATPGMDGRTLGFAQRDSTGYSIYIENGSPKLAAMATLAHELTHIWQYMNWDDKALAEKYGAHNRLEIYEGMAKWAEIQYLLYLNEINYAKREEILTRIRDDEYGRGFIKYAEKYSLSYEQGKKDTPFDHEFPF